MTIHHGDCVQVMADMPEASIDVTPAGGTVREYVDIANARLTLALDADPVAGNQRGLGLEVG